MSGSELAPGDVPGDARTLHEAVFRHAGTRPEALAVEGPDGAVTFGELAAAARRVAATLLRDGAGGTVVVQGGTSPETLAAALGVMAAGAAVVPVAPGDPAARVAVVLADSGARAFVTTTPSGGALPVVDLRTVLADAADLPAVSPTDLPAVSPTDLAYVLFTSGSAGRPKGVMVEHRNVLAYVRYVAGAYRVDGTVPPLPALTPPSFDASVLQTYAVLARGEAVWLLPAGVREDPVALVAALRARPGCGLHCVPSLWEEILREVEHGGALPLRALLLGGEVVRPDLWERTRRALPGTRLANVYGPTEATVQATGGFQPPGAPLTVGRPVTGTRITVRDGHGTVLAAGVRGEVYLGGAGVGRGYLGQDELTAERFLVEEGVRVFRTGDAGTLSPDGTLVVHGRLDDQVKVRGYRIEPADVEAALLRHPALAGAAVAAQHPGSGVARLVAAVVAHPAHSRDVTAGVEELRAHLATELPAYLIPTLIRVVDRLPYAASGKLDRVAVAALFDAPEPAHGSAAPIDDEIVATVAAVWTDLLGSAPSGPDDDFFLLGGHSLLATRFVARLRKAFGRPVPLRTVFDHRTFGTVTAAVRALTGAGPAAEPAHAAAGQPVPLSLQQRALWHDEQVAPGMATAHVVLPLRLTGDVAQPRVVEALQRLVGRHEALRTVVDPEQPGQRVRTDPAVPLDVHDLRDAGGVERDQGVRAIAWRAYRAPFDLTVGPPLRAVWVRLADNESVLLIVLHHIACDGTSLRIIVADLTRLLNHLPEAATPGATYRDFTVWQLHRYTSGALEPQRQFWAERLAAPRDAVRWPLPPVERRTYRHALIAVDAPSTLTAAVEVLASAHRTSPLVVACAALGLLLHRRYGTGEPAIGILAANRTHADFDGTVGIFATTLVLRIPVDADDSFAGLLATAREAALQATAHQELPLDAVLDAAAAGDPPMDVALVMDLDAATAPAVAGPVAVSTIVPETEDVPTGVVLAPTPITVFAGRHGTGLRFAAEYSTDLFNEKEARVFLENLVAILQEATGQGLRRPG